MSSRRYGTPNSEMRNYRSPNDRHANTYGLTLHYAPAETLVQVKYMTPRSSRQRTLEPSVEERRHYRGRHRSHRRSHHQTPETHHQRPNPAYPNPYAPPNPALRPARGPVPAPAPPVISAQAYTSHATASQMQRPVGVRPAPAPQTYFTNTAPVIPLPVPTSAPAPPRHYPTNNHGASPTPPYDPEPYTRYFDPSGAPVPRVLPSRSTVVSAPPTQKADPRPCRSRRLSNALKSFFHKGDGSRAAASAAPQVAYVPVPPAPPAQPAAHHDAAYRPAASDHTVGATRRAKETTTRPSSAFNIYTRDMLPQIYGVGRNFERDPHWQGAGKEKINVLMPVGLLDCWSIFFNARNLKEIHFWHIKGDDSWREFPTIRVRGLKSLYIHLNEAWLTNLLDAVRVRHLRHLEVYYSSGGGGRFSYDKQAYVRLVGAIRHGAAAGFVGISPNHPVYGARSSSLEATLEAAVEQDAPRWTFHICDERS
ncbi:uncharacterized protein SCHCODRAFT_02745866 [Schizophyllum commune H4-8]|uniref:Uncharacterized protein n=1 Tax=Schizophyllum commune (strain H4-8 / FGSC 9210) TaxID=578458 RepID=D8PXN9_SCHCM|nr:uncharacterized protein SCHCODRAFT_02745866 [Schizophyllum commune H4-8]KAI5896990.1 hypothetical protein SCHCODRAFT_02745866 [Schizophyllum commune H4-8]